MSKSHKKCPSGYSWSACGVSRKISFQLFAMLLLTLSGIACAQTVTTTSYGYGAPVVSQTTTYGAPVVYGTPYVGGYYSARPAYGVASVRGQSRRVSRRTSRRVSRRR